MPAKRGTFRIIGGEWRSRILPIPAVAEVRPTTDRIRETLFNWLQLDIVSSSCLDLFAGSGALGFEALSRGASTVTMVDSQRPVIKSLQQSAALLGANAEIVQSDCLSFLNHCRKQYAIIFLDPPFQSDLLSACVAAICQRKLLTERGVIYLESPKGYDETTIRDYLQNYKQKQSGQVTFGLWINKPPL